MTLQLERYPTDVLRFPPARLCAPKPLHVSCHTTLLFSDSGKDHRMALEYVVFPVLPIVQVHLIINCVLVLLTLIVVGLRLLARFDAKTKLWWDDYLILLALPQ